jgi:hypothetical protein
VALNADQSFQETFVEEMAFPNMGARVWGLGAGETPEPNPQHLEPST